MGKWVASMLNVIVVLALGLSYLELLKFVMTGYVSYVGNQTESHQKMIMTALCSLFSAATVSALNAFITRRSPLLVGASSAVFAFSYFYIIRSDDRNVIVHIYSILMSGYSLFAMVVFIGMPLIIGYVLNKRCGKNKA